MSFGECSKNSVLREQHSECYFSRFSVQTSRVLFLAVFLWIRLIGRFQRMHGGWRTIRWVVSNS
jgi:hypothetical protein